MKRRMRRHIGIVAALALLMTLPPQFVLSEDMVPVQILTADSQDEAEQAEMQAAAEAEAQAAAEAEAQAAAEAEAQAAAQAAAEAEAQAAAQAAAEAEAQAAAQAAAEAEAQAAAEAEAQAAAQAAAEAEAQAAVETPVEAAPAQGAESSESPDEADEADDSQSAEEQEVLPEETEGSEPAEEELTAAEETAPEAEETEEDLEAAEGEETYAYALDSIDVGTPSLGGPYTIETSISGLTAPATTYTIAVTHTFPDSTVEDMTKEETVSDAGIWQYGTSSSGPWSELTTVPSDKSEVYVRYYVPARELSFMGMDGTEQSLSVPEAASEAVVLNRKYPQLFSPTIAQNGNYADYAFTMDGYPGTSITMCLVNRSGAMIGSGTVNMTDLPSAKKVVNHFLSGEWDLNLFGLQESDINQYARLKVVQNEVATDAISPCAPFYSNELYLVSPIRGKVALPSPISVGTEVSVDKSQMKNISNLGLNYQWYLGAGDSAKPVSGGNDSTYIVSIEDLVSYGSKVLSCSITDVLGKTLYTQEVTVQPLDLSSPEVDIDWDEEAVYTGSKTFPSDIIVSVGSYEIPKDMWKVGKVSGKNCVNIGEAWMTIKGIGEFVTGSVKVKYKIGNGSKPQPKPTPAPKAAPAPAPEDLTVTDSLGKAKRYEIRIVDETTEDQSEDEQAEAAKIYEVNTFDDSTVDGETVYSQRNLHITRDMINKAKEAGCSVIRLRVKDGGIDLAISELTKDSYTVRLAPEDGKDLTSEESSILAQYNPQGEMYRVSVRTKNADGEEIDVIDTMLEAKALLFGDREANTECLQIAYDNLEPAVNNVKVKSAGSTNYLSASIFKRSLFSGTLVG